MHIITNDLSYKVKSFEILKQINLNINNKVVGILGPNGAGKTTLMSIIVKLMNPTSGTVYHSINETNITNARELYKNLGYLPQKFQYFKDFTTKEFVEYVALLKGVPAKESSVSAEEILREVKLEDKINAKIKTLSGGMIQRVGVAQAMVNDPSLLILDEPTVGLDPTQRINFRDLIRRKAENKTVLLSTHLVEDVAAICDYVMILNKGSLIFTGTLEEMLQHNNLEMEGDSDIERSFTNIILKSENAE